MIEIYFDGSCEPRNPGGTARVGVVIIKDKKLEKEISGAVGSGFLMSCNVAEYEALNAGLQFLLDAGLEKEFIKIRGDSDLVVKQMQGLWKIKKGLYKEYAIKCFGLMKKFKRFSIEWIPREQNFWADLLTHQKEDT